MRAVLFRIFRKKSPFEGLKNHAEKLVEGVGKLRSAVNAYLDEDFEAFEKFAEEVIRIENEADLIKGNVRNHLPKGIFMPVDRGDFLSCLREQDSVIDACEDAVVWLQFRRGSIDGDFKRKLKEYMSGIISMVENVAGILMEIHRLIGSISIKERKRVKEKIKSLHFDESETDAMERQLIKQIFASGKDMMDVYHLIHVIFFLGHIADHAENIGDRIRVMMAK